MGVRLRFCDGGGVGENCTGEMSDWFVVATKPRKEAQAAFNLSNQGFDVFLPQMRKTIRHARRTFVGAVPLFPAYLFLEASSAGRWRSVNGTMGVKHIITGGEHPLAVEPGFVEALICKADGNGVIDLNPGFGSGDAVELLEGPFARQIGRLIDLDARGRASVLMEFLAGSVPVHTTVDNLVRA